MDRVLWAIAVVYAIEAIKSCRQIPITRLHPWRTRGLALLGAAFAAFWLAEGLATWLTFTVGQLLLQQVVFDVIHRPSGWLH